MRFKAPANEFSTAHANLDMLWPVWVHGGHTGENMDACIWELRGKKKMCLQISIRNYFMAVKTDGGHQNLSSGFMVFHSSLGQFRNKNFIGYLDIKEYQFEQKTFYLWGCI